MEKSERYPRTVRLSKLPKTPIMRHLTPVLALALMICTFGCSENNTSKSASLNSGPMKEANFTEEKLTELTWLNQPDSFEIEDGVLQIEAAKGTDFFIDPADSTKTATAPLLYTTVKHDFVATALVRPDFSSLWNAVSLMVYFDDQNWIKFAFENSDATGKSIVSVVTKDISDDANGVILEDHDEIWLRMIKKGNTFAMFWSVDGKDFRMTRVCAFPEAESVMIGVEAQCPVGDSARHEILYFEVEHTTVQDLRKGI